jgi:Golgi apparatus protein 1
MAEDIDFKYPTRKACAWEISNFCKNIPHGHARVIRCLQVCG